MRLWNDKKCVSEVMGTLLLLTVSIGIFTIVYYSILSTQPAPSSPPLNIIATIDEKNIVVIHAGGKPLDMNSKILVTIAGTTYEGFIYDYMDEDSKTNQKWDVGEKIIYPVGDVTGLQVDLALRDHLSNSLVFFSNLQ